MHPDHQEIVEVGDAFISLAYTEYSPKEQEFIDKFLNQYATVFNESEINGLFKNKTNIIQAIKTLNDFTQKYKSDEDVIQEFNEEIHDLLINLNGNRESIAF